MLCFLCLRNHHWNEPRLATVHCPYPTECVQEVSEQRPHKVSYKLYAADAPQAQAVIFNLRSHLSAAGLDANVIFSGGVDVDVLPSRASKGRALSFLLQQVHGRGFDGFIPRVKCIQAFKGPPAGASPPLCFCPFLSTHPSISP
jgi:hypothetical protein